jgi:uncharacterized membrane protein YqiK
MEMLVTIGILAGFLVGFIFVGLIIIAKFRVVPEADQAIVVTGTTVKDPTTGVEKPKVIVGGGIFIVPIFHKARIVSLEVVQIPIQAKGQNASLPSQDRIPVELEGELTVQVDGSNPDQVILASQKLGVSDPTQMVSIVTKKADKLVQAALRTAVFEFNFVDLNAKKEDFEKRVHELLQKDLARLGLTLTAVSIPSVAQGAFSAGEGDMFDAEGRRKVAEITEAARTQTNDIQKENEIARARRNRQAREQELAIEFEVKQKESDQAREVAAYEANQTRQTTEAVLTERKAEALAKASQAREVAEAQALEAEKTEKAMIAQAEAVAIRQAQAKAAQQAADETAAAKIATASAERKVIEEQATAQELEAEIAKNKTVEAAKIAKQQVIEAAAIEKQRVVEVAAEGRKQAVETAEVTRQQAVALARADEAAARATQAEALAKQTAAEEAVTTVSETASAARAKDIVVIKAREAAEKDQIDADKDAYVLAKVAEGERDATVKRAEAVKAEAEGRAEAARADAEGRAKAKVVEAEAYATDLTTRAQAEFDAAQKQAEAKKLLAEATLAEGQADAEATRLLVEAQNQVSMPVIARDVAVEILSSKVLPDMIREFMVPMKDVAGQVQVLNIQGLGGGDGEGANDAVSTIMGTGMALMGATPLVRAAVEGFTKNDDVKAVAAAVSGVAKGVLHEAAEGIAAGVAEGVPGASVAAAAAAGGSEGSAAAPV